MGFENKDDFPLEQEFDEYDNHSTHFLVRHKQSGQWIGAMRLIYKNDQLLPIEQHCVLNETIDKNDLGQSVELSRLCLIKEIRRRFNEIDPPHGIIDESKEVKESDKVKLLHNHHRCNRSIIWGLLRAASEYGYHNNIQHCFFLTTAALAKVIRKGGLQMLDIGDPCYHKGERYPFKMNAVETYQNTAWSVDYKAGYRKFSESDLLEKLRAA
jgi:N-acyl amino acid synthase of PEP-CTERM/exosortase system